MKVGHPRTAFRPRASLRLGYLVSHPIQYHAPVFRALSKRPDVEFSAHFCHDHGLEPCFDPGFGQLIRFDVPLLEGYRYQFLRNVAPRSSLRPTGQLNPAVVKLVRSCELDALIVHGYSPLSNILALLTPLRRTRLLLRGDSTRMVVPPFAKRVTKQAILRLLFARADGFLHIGTLNAAYYRSYGVPDERMTFSPLAIDNDHFANGSEEARRDRVAARVALGLPPTGALILSVGKLIPIKRCLDVLRAFSRVRHDPPPTLAYVGDGPVRTELEHEIRALGLGRRVTVLGFRNQSELPAIYGAADVLVLASDGEPWGLVVNEAMAAGVVPILSDRVGAVVDLSPAPECVFPMGDTQVLTRRMEELIANPDRLERLRQLCRERVSAYGVEASVEGMVRGARRACNQPLRSMLPRAHGGLGA